MFKVKKDEFVNKTFRIPVELLKKLEILAQNEKVSLNNLVIQCCEYALNNMKSGLSKSTKMTVPNFIKWCEILGLDWELTISDNGEDNINPLSETIVVSNKT